MRNKKKICQGIVVPDKEQKGTKLWTSYRKSKVWQQCH